MKVQDMVEKEKKTAQTKATNANIGVYIKYKANIYICLPRSLGVRPAA
jgi:hypothetical protein